MSGVYNVIGITIAEILRWWTYFGRREIIVVPITITNCLKSCELPGDWTGEREFRKIGNNRRVRWNGFVYAQRFRPTANQQQLSRHRLMPDGSSLNRIGKNNDRSGVSEPDNTP